MYEFDSVCGKDRGSEKHPPVLRLEGGRLARMSRGRVILSCRAPGARLEIRPLRPRRTPPLVPGSNKQFRRRNDHEEGFEDEMGFFLTVVLVFLAGPAVGEAFLCEGEVTGTVVEISDGVPAYIVVAPDEEGSADLEFTGIPVAYLENFLAAKCEYPELTLLNAGVTITYHECPGLDGADAVLKACSIAIIDITGCDADATADADAIVTFELPLRRGHFYRVPPVPAAPEGPPDGAGGGPGNGRRGRSN